VKCRLGTLSPLYAPPSAHVQNLLLEVNYEVDWENLMK